MRMDAYYYGFAPTGIANIDRILSAVACAGKAYHHTENWCDDCGPWEPDHPGQSPVDWIADAAFSAAEAQKALIEALEAARDAANQMELSSAHFPREKIEAALTKARGEVRP